MDLSEKTIHELQSVLKLANQGDRRAFEQLMRRFEARFRVLVQKMLWRYPKLRRWEETDDVYQQAMIRLYQSLQAATPNSITQFVGLSATQIRRTLIDLSRHYFGILGLGKKHHTDGGGAADDAGGAIDRHQLKPESFSIEQWSEFHQAVEQLPDEPRVAFEMVWYAGMKQNEAAELLGISRRTLIRRLNQARCLMSERLASQ